MQRLPVRSALIFATLALLGAGNEAAPAPTPNLPAHVAAPQPTASPVTAPEKPAPKENSKNPAPFDTRDKYEVQQIEGWRIIVNKKLLQSEGELSSDTLKLLAAKLYDITRVVPPPALAKLRRIAIWVELNEPHTPCMCYHPEVQWLRDNGMNPEKAGCVELANARTFLKWSFDQPWMVLHELSHGYHHQFLADGFENKEILAAYQHAMEAKLYDSVLRSGGRIERAYAATNQMEYFAESCEAYFGTNDFYPFVKTELHQHDPQCYETLKKVWGIDGAHVGN